MNNKVLASLAVVLCLQLSAGRNVYIINNASETLSIKGPTKSTNKAAIPVTLKPGELVVKDVDAEGKATDMLDLTIAGTSSKALKKYQAKYAKAHTAILISSDSDDLELSQADAFTKPRITNTNVF